MSIGNPLPMGLAGIPQDTGLGPLKRSYGMAPFSTWDTRQADWMSRRRLWLARGLTSELGREEKLTYQIPEKLADGTAAPQIGNGTSVFDPVVCELAINWWSPPGGVVLDPFAGGSVRGIITSLLGRKYWGCELRREQVEANRNQVASNPRLSGEHKPVWVCGDSAKVFTEGLKGRLPPEADCIFSCPPYGDLEVYSKDPDDISNRDSYEDFLADYSKIISAAVARLRQDSFAVWVVGNYRNKDNGTMRDFVGDTVRAFRAAGAAYYNDIILINSVGSGAMRGRRTFDAAAKVIKLHQNVLVFVKGDAKVANAKITGRKDASAEE